MVSELGLIIKKLAPHSHEQNGRTERSGGVLINRATKLRLSANQPKPKTPMASDAMLPYEQQASDYEILLYQQKVGSIIYATFIIRPDIA